MKPLGHRRKINVCPRPQEPLLTSLILEPYPGLGSGASVKEACLGAQSPPGLGGQSL